MSDSQTLLMPRRRHFRDLAVLLIAVCIAVAVSVYVASGGKEAMRAAGVLGLIIIIALAFYFRLGRFVVIDHTQMMVSTPTIFTRKNVRFLSLREIKDYEKVYDSLDDELVVGLFLSTNEGKKAKYWNIRTPGCVPEILEMLKSNGVSEMITQKRIVR